MPLKSSPPNKAIASGLRPFASTTRLRRLNENSTLGFTSMDKYPAGRVKNNVPVMLITTKATAPNKTNNFDTKVFMIFQSFQFFLFCINLMHERIDLLH